MNLIDKLKYTSPSRLADRIKSTEGELGRLISAHDQAEAEAIAQAGEDIAYQKAADRAAELGRQVSEKRERLDRLRMAHKAALAREQEDLIEDLRSKHERLVSVCDQTRKEVDRLRTVEDRRHKKEADRLDRRLADAELAELEADIALNEEELKRTKKDVADTEADGDRDGLVFERGCLQGRENALQSLRVKRSEILAKIGGA